jgi:hypothetical protein
MDKKKNTSALSSKKDKNTKRKKQDDEDEFKIEPSNGMIYKFFSISYCILVNNHTYCCY